jgi:hypothetical protein
LRRARQQQKGNDQTDLGAHQTSGMIGNGQQKIGKNLPLDKPDRLLNFQQG